jgi:hypothetical protein
MGFLLDPVSLNGIDPFFAIGVVAAPPKRVAVGALYAGIIREKEDCAAPESASRHTPIAGVGDLQT